MFGNASEVMGRAVELDAFGNEIAEEKALLSEKQKEVLICVGFGAAVGAVVASALPAVTVKFGVGLGLAVGTAVGII